MAPEEAKSRTPARAAVSGGTATQGEPRSHLAPAAEEIAILGRGVNKSYGGIQALKDIDVTVRAASIHGLVGENGAGKSTLGRILGGAIAPDSGELCVRGRPANYRTPREALADGIAVIQQELALVPGLSVLDNVFLGHESRRWGVTRRREMCARLERLAEESGFAVSPGARVGDLPLALQQQVEILRALSQEVSILVMDEPTSALDRTGAEKLYEVMRSLRRRGITVIFVSHFLDEVMDLTDELTILRNGSVAAACATNEITLAGLVEHMLGRSEAKLVATKRKRDRRGGGVGFAVRELCSDRIAEPVSFEIRSGEVLGIAGLVGSGRSEIARAIVGADRPTGGRVEVDGSAVRIRKPSDALRARVLLIPESRKEEGLVLNRSQRENVSICAVGSVTRGPLVSRRGERDAVGAMVRRVGGDPGRLEEPVERLSGGNQQKAVFAKALFANPRVLILDEPTRGVDIGAKAEIYRLIDTLTEESVPILLISSEFDEIVALCDRVLVLRQGHPLNEVSGAEISTDRLTRLALGAESTAAVDAKPSPRADTTKEVASE
jgi:ABC-type sugar transport system ATPase subunit